jgi:hypothetical protein
MLRVVVSQQTTTFLLWKRKCKHIGTGFVLHKGILSAVTRVEFISDRISNVILKGLWWNIIVLNVHAATEDKNDDMKGSFHEEGIERVLMGHFPKYHMGILLGNFNGKLEGEHNFKSTIGNKNLHKSNKGNGVKVVKIATSKNLISKYTVPTS